ncbi:MAG: DUF1513 domain-containing protein [Pseudomonadales bacterium]|nr:DUF1513 domain-containing protein [Pseudomonadales bacterium]
MNEIPKKIQHDGLNRRQFMLGSTALLMSQSSFALTNFSEKKETEILLSAQGNESNRYGLSWVANQNLQTTLSGFRGHGLAKHGLNKNSVLLFARRPGNKAIEVDVSTGDITNTFRCLPDHHLFGHGCFSADGKVLYTSEANYVTGQGKIGVRDANSYQLLAEIPSYGVGPHEIKLMPDGKTLVVANGGIQTHPSSGRKKLNLDTMDSSLAYVDVQTGNLLDQFRVKESKASIRHLDVADDGTVAFAMQMQRSASNHESTVGLAGMHRPGEALHVFENPEPVVFQMNDYAGSVAINRKSRVVGFTSPRGNIAVFWHLDSRDYIGYHGLHDVCGLAVSLDQNYFLISNSNGQLRHLDSVTLKEDKSKRLNMPDTHWDNHLLVMSL